MESWITLDNPEQIRIIASDKSDMYFIIFKHSTRCSLSDMIYRRLSSKLKITVPFYFLDLIRHRDLSNLISVTFGIQHESPQVLIIKNGKCIYHESHSGIVPGEIANAVAA